MREIKTKYGFVRVDDDVYNALQNLNALVYLHHGRYYVNYKEQGRTKAIALTAFISGKSGRECNVGFLDEDCKNCLRINLVLGNKGVKKSRAKQYYGVNKNNNRYQARISVDGTRLNVITVGTYLDEVTAAIAYNKAMDRVYGVGKYIKNKPNISKELYARCYAEIQVDLVERSGRQGTNRKLKATTSIYTGVCKALNNGVWRGKWAAAIYYKTKNIHLGRFDGEISAAQAYNQAAEYLYGAEAKLNKVPRPMHYVIDIAKLRQKSK